MFVLSGSGQAEFRAGETCAACAGTRFACDAAKVAARGSRKLPLEDGEQSPPKGGISLGAKILHYPAPKAIDGSRFFHNANPLETV